MRHKFKTVVKCSAREHTIFYTGWLRNNAGEREEDWTFQWDEGDYYIVSTRREEDMLAFRLAFKCES